MCFLSSGQWKSRIKRSAGWISPKASLFDLAMPVSCLWPHIAFLLCLHLPGVSPYSYEDTGHIGLAPNPEVTLAPEHFELKAIEKKQVQGELSSFPYCICKGFPPPSLPHLPGRIILRKMLYVIHREGTVLNLQCNIIFVSPGFLLVSP